MKNLRKRSISLFLAVLMVFLQLPATAFAEPIESEQDSEQTIEASPVQEDNLPEEQLIVDDRESSSLLESDGSIIDSSHFPDANFRAMLNEWYPDGLTLAQAADVTCLSVSECGIHSLNGISYFPNLLSLFCGQNSLTSLDVSGCPALEVLACGENSLTSLDVSGCPGLETLDCCNNSLTSLDVSGCPVLKSLYCFGNPSLTSLVLCNCPELEYLSCGGNRLTSLDVSGCPKLQLLYCYSNSLTSLDVSRCPVLETLECDENSLASLNVSGCPVLKSLDCNYNFLTSLDVSGCPMLEYLGCSWNSLTSLDLSNNSAITTLYCLIQTIANANATLIDGDYYVDMAEVVGAENMSRISADEYDEETGLLKVDKVSGKNTVAGTYRYNTALNDQYMEVDLVDVVYDDSPKCTVGMDVSGISDYNTVTWWVMAEEGEEPYRYYCEIYQLVNGEGYPVYTFSNNEDNAFTYSFTSEYSRPGSTAQTTGDGTYYAEVYVKDNNGNKSAVVKSDTITIPYVRTSIQCSNKTGVIGEQITWTVKAALGYNAKIKQFCVVFTKNGEELDTHRTETEQTEYDYTYTPTEKGTYKLKAWAELEDGTKSVPTENEIEVKETLSLSVGVTSVEESTITWTARTDSPNVSRYKFTLYKDDKEIDTITKETTYNTKTMDYTYTCEKGGVYYVKVSCTSSYGNESEDNVKSEPYTMVSKPEIRSVEVQNAAYTGDTLTCIVEASGLGRLSYHFVLSKYNNLTEKYEVHYDAGSLAQGSFTYNLQSEGDYCLEICVSNDDDECSETVTKYITVTDAPAPTCRSFYVDVAHPEVGSAQTWVVYAAGGRPELTYIFYRLKDGEYYDGTDWIQDNYHTFEYTEPGTYRVCFNVMDRNGSYAGLFTSEEIVVTEHNHTNHAVHFLPYEATETEDGNIECWYCTECELFFLDEDCTIEAEPEDIIIKYSDPSTEITASGTCGENVNWVLTADGTLTISGTGAMAGRWEEIAAGNDLYFEYSEMIQSVVITEGVTEIGEDCFYGLSNLTDVSLPDSLETIGGYAFGHCTSLVEISIPSGVTSIGYDPFWGDSALQNITVDVGNKVYSSKDGALYTNNGETLLLVPNGKTGNFTIPEGTIVLNEFAFQGCNQITSISIPSTLCDASNDDISSYGEVLFNDIEGNALTAFVVSEDNAYYCSVDGVVFSKDKTQLLRYPTGRTGSYTVPDGVLEIGFYAFRDCTGLESVTLDADLVATSIGAFCRCSSLTSVTLPDNFSSLGDWTFARCTGLQSITIPCGCRFDGTDPFYDDSTSESTTLQSLQTIYYAGTETRWNSLTDGVNIPETAEIIFENQEYVSDNIIDAEHFPDSAFLEALLSEYPGGLSAEAAANVRELNVSECGIASLQGIQYFSGLQYLYCWENSLSSLDVSGCPNLRTLFCSYNSLPSLDVSGCPELVDLYCGENSLTSLDVSGCPALEVLYCGSNSLPSLDVSGCPELCYLDCGGNSLTSLDLSGCPAMVALYCGENHLAKLDISNCTAISTLYPNPQVLTTVTGVQVEENYFVDMMNLVGADGLEQVSAEGYDPETELLMLSGNSGSYTYKTADHLDAMEVTISEVVAEDMVLCGVHTDRSQLQDENTVTWQVTAVGGTAPYTYHGAIYCINEEDRENDTLFYEFPDSENPSLTYSFGDSPEGVYYAAVCVTDAEGNASDWEYSYSIAFPYAGISVTSDRSIYISGEEITWNITTDAGAGVSLTGVQVQVLQDGEEVAASTCNLTDGQVQYSYTPESAGSYQLNVAAVPATAHGMEAVELLFEVRDAIVGDDITWSMDPAGVLTLSGTGEMYDYTEQDPPWYSCRTKITKVVLSEGATDVGAYAFFDCSAVSEVSLPDSLQRINEGAFEYCDKLEEIDIPDQVSEIGQYVFWGCYALKNITIPASVTAIGEGAFDACEALTDVYYEGTQAQWEQVTNHASLPEGVTIHYYDPCTEGHDWDEGVVTKEPTETEEGERTYTCQREGCGATKTETIPAQVVTSATVTVGNGAAKPGETVDITFTLSNAPEVKAINIRNITFDTGVLTLESGTWLIDGVVKNVNIESKAAVISMEQNTDVNGGILKLTFRISEDAEDGEYPVSCEGSVKQKLSDTQTVDVETVYVAGNITVQSVLPGDMDGDGVFTDEDAIYLLYAYMMPDLFELNQNADFDGNGVFTDDDAIYLLYCYMMPDDFPMKNL